MTNDNQICGRCNGTGSYSYHLQYGTMCLQCKGTGLANVAKTTQATIPTPYGAKLQSAFGIVVVFIPKAPRSTRGVTVRFKSEEEALKAYPQAVRA